MLIRLQEDRLCWVSEEDIQHAGASSTAHAPLPMTLYPSASAALPSDASTSAPTVEQVVRTGLPLVNYIPLDRIPVRSTPRGYVPGSAISRVANTQVVQQGLGAAFAVTAGSHTLFFSAPSETAADKWVEAIQDAWTHCTMNVLRCVQASTTAAEQAQSNEQMLAAMNASLRFEQQQLITELQQVEGTPRPHTYVPMLNDSAIPMLVTSVEQYEHCRRSQDGAAGTNQSWWIWFQLSWPAQLTEQHAGIS